MVARDGAGAATRLVGTVTDITERKEDELRYQALFHAARDAIMVIEDGRIVDCNPATTDLLGYPREVIVGRSPEDFSPTRQPGGHPSPALAASINSRAATGDQVFEWVHRRKDGELVDVEVSLTPLPSPGGNAALAMVRDLTQRKKMQEAMIRTEKMASLGSLAAGMANEINNPLAIILHGAQGTLRRLDPDLAPNAQAAKRHDIDLARVLDYMRERHILLYLDAIREAGERAAGIVRGMLTFCRVPESARERADINALVESGLALAASEYDPKTRYDFRRITHRQAPDPGHAPGSLHAGPDQAGRPEPFAQRGPGPERGRHPHALHHPAHLHPGRSGSRRGRGQRTGHPRGCPAPHLRALLHHQENPAAARGWGCPWPRSS